MGKPQSELDPFRTELDELRIALGNRIRDLRKQRGWSQEEFSAHAHVHRTFAGALERGEKNLSFHALVLISRSFDVTLSALLEGLERGEKVKSKPGPKTRLAEVEHRILEEVAAMEDAARRIKEAVFAAATFKR